MAAKKPTRSKPPKSTKPKLKLKLKPKPASVAAAEPATALAPTAVPAALAAPMPLPPSGVTIRMYRQGHGDCFLLAFRQDDGTPFYMLIDCGMKKGSNLTYSMSQVVQNIWDATGGHLHLVAITHEHEDHVSGFLSERNLFDQFTIDKLWLAWTEDPRSELANELREKYHDTLLGLLSAEQKLAEVLQRRRAATEEQQLGAAGGDVRANDRVHRVIDGLLGFELSDELRGLGPAAREATIKGRTNKEGILVVKARADAKLGTDYMRPHTEPRTLPNVTGVRVFILGPPENAASLRDMDPQGEEEFHFAAAEERSFLAAVADNPTAKEAFQPFAARHRVTRAKAAQGDYDGFFCKWYLDPNSPDKDDQAWRRIDGDWLRSSETFALRMSKYINNTSLVLAVELPTTKKVMLLVGDAQRGNWVSWHDKPCPDGNGGQVTATDLLARTVFYKVGHHGSHNATMNQKGLKDMGAGRHANEFVAMIPANEKWATTANDPPWMHPLKAIYEALLKKAKGRVFVMDRDFRAPFRKALEDDEWIDHLTQVGTTPAEWAAFQDNAVTNDLYYEFTVTD